VRVMTIEQAFSEHARVMADASDGDKFRDD
jgi:hypothetical protein